MKGASGRFGLGDVIEGARGYLLIAATALAFAIIFLVAELISADRVIWLGRCVPAWFDGGVAHYTVAGQAFTADNPPPVDRSPRMVTVCYDPAEPVTGYIVRPAAYWVEGGLVGGPAALALTMAGVGLLGSMRRLRHAPRLPPLPSLERRPG
jgi:hypothetical protein